MVLISLVMTIGCQHWHQQSRGFEPPIQTTVCKERNTIFNQNHEECSFCGYVFPFRKNSKSFKV